MVMNLEKEIEKIKKVLIDFQPDYFKVAFCKHKWEQIQIP